MRVLWLSHFVPWPPTGHGALQRSHHLLRQAASRHEVHLVAVAPPSTITPEMLEEAGRELPRLTASTSLFSLPGDHLTARRLAQAARAAVSARTYWEIGFDAAAARRRIAELTRAHRFDVAHVDTVFLAPYLDALGGTPVVLTHHNIEGELLRRRADTTSSRVGRLFFGREAAKTEALDRRLATRAACNVVVSDLDGERLRRLVPNARIRTVPNGVDVAFFGGAAPGGGQPGHMVFAGGMNWYPNHDAMTVFARELWPALSAADAGRAMTVVGRDPPPALLELAARDERVRAVGFVDDVRPYVERASAYVCPIRVGGGTRLKVLDALAMGRPLVATALAVEGIGLEPEVHYLRAESAGDYVGALARLDADPALRGRLATEGRAFVERGYAWSVIGERLDEAYALAAAAGGGAAASDPRTAGEIAARVAAV